MDSQLMDPIANRLDVADHASLKRATSQGDIDSRFAHGIFQASKPPFIGVCPKNPHSPSVSCRIHSGKMSSMHSLRSTNWRLRSASLNCPPFRAALGRCPDVQFYWASFRRLRVIATPIVKRPPARSRVPPTCAPVAARPPPGFLVVSEAVETSIFAVDWSELIGPSEVSAFTVAVFATSPAATSSAVNV